jgi:hypothetical protein
MTDLKNQFRWSVTRHRHFEACQRLYYLSHYAHWGGWELGADEFARACYRLGKMKNLDIWAGEIVHDVICEALQKLRANQPTTLDAMTARAIHKLRTGWLQSKKEEWRVDAKRRLNLFEHYYGLPIPPERTDEIKQRVLQCLENFWRSEALAFIGGVPPEQWKALEEFQYFRVEDFEVVLKMDLALAQEDWLYIYDWKTGREDEGDLMQLVCYALYAMKTWGFSADRIKIILAYLRDGVFQQRDVSPSDIIEAKDTILQSGHRMMSLLTDPVRNVARMEIFPMTSARWKCKRCFFWEACYGNRVIEGSSDP